MMIRVVLAFILGMSGSRTVLALWDQKPHVAAVAFGIFATAMFLRVILAEERR
jgi:hypothetical protein